jgi:hypothetical protein
MNDERIDFSVLDPAQKQVRWACITNALVDRALAERHALLSVGEQLLHWARTVLVVTAGLCIVAWSARLLSGSQLPQTATTEMQPALRLSNWAANNQMPEPSDFFGTLRGN